MKIKTLCFLLCIGAISISTIVGIAFLPPRWSYIFYGVLAFVIGSVVQTKEWKTGKRIRAVVFIIAIAVGGLLTTKGWNEWGNYSQKKTLLTALAREWLVNETYQHLKPLSFDPNDPNFGKKTFMYYPFKTFTFNSVMASNLFDLRDKDELELCSKIMLYEMHATICNEWFTLLNWQLTRKSTTKERRKLLYQGMVGSPLYSSQFKESHREIEMLLKTRYNWALEEAVLLLGGKLQKAIKERYNWPLEEVLNNRDSK